MLLTRNFLDNASNYSELKSFNAHAERVSKYYYRVILEKENIIIHIDIEELEPSASFIVTHKKKDKLVYYYALADYSPITGKVKCSAFASDEEEEKFIKEYRRLMRKHQKILSTDRSRDAVVTYIYTFLNDFVKKLES